MTEKSKGGRPSIYSEELVDEICERLSNGEPLAVICRDEHMPGVTTVHGWCSHAEHGHRVSEAIAHARRSGHDAIAWRMRQTARKQGDSTGDVLRDKLIIETDLKLLSKWDPKRYGDKLDVTSNGEGLSGIAEAIALNRARVAAALAEPQEPIEGEFRQIEDGSE